MSQTTKEAPTGLMALTIDDKEINVKKGSTVLEAAKAAGIYIPTLCYHPALPPYGGCRLCIVEIEKMRGLPPSCSTPATGGMVIHTNTKQLQEMRRSILELLLTEHPHACLVCWRRKRCSPFDICLRNVEVTQRCVLCPKNERCELQEVADYIGITEVTFPYTYRNLPVETGDPFFDRDYNLCILCGRCVRVCQEVRGRGALAFTFRGSRALVGTAFGSSLEEAGSEFCGACVDVCPTGALMERSRKWKGLPDRKVITTCPYCGVGCQLALEVKGGKLISSVPDPDGPANHGQGCVKGRFGIAEMVHHPERLTTPLIRKGGKLERATWEEALELVASKLSSYKTGEVAVFGSGKTTNEDNYVVQKLARVVLGTNNVDHCARLCHAPSVAGLAQSFGSGAMTNSIAEIAEAATILAIGTNTRSAHPVIGLQMVRAVQRGAKLIMVNPREIDLGRFADMWLPLRPGTDVALLMGMMRVILDEGLEDRDFVEQRCEDFASFKESLAGFDLEQAERITGVSKELIAKAARLYATKKPSTIVYAMGITQHSHGTDNVLALANLAMLTGNIGKPSTGVNPLRGHNNVQGACDVAALPNVYPGYQPVADPATRKKFEKIWECNLDPSPGLTLTEIVDAVAQGSIKALYIAGENPLLSDPNINHAEEALNTVEFLVVQDLFLSETARKAHVVLPAASFAERDGTFTNTERRVQLVCQAIEPIGDSRPDWWITCQIAKRLGGKGFDYQHPSEIMEEIARLSPSYAGISYSRLKAGGIQWPCPSSDHPGTPFLHAVSFPRGKGKFVPLKYRPSAELPDQDYPFILTTERSLYHFHTGTLTRKVKDLNTLAREEKVQISPQDAERLGIQDGDVVRVISRRGEVRTKAGVTAASQPGVVSMTFHYSESPTNRLTGPAIDPVAKIPEFKVTAVRIEKAQVLEKV